MKLKLLYLFLIQFLLNLVSAQTFTNIAGVQSMLSGSISSDTYGNGLSFFDFNQDGWDDLSFAMENDTQVFYINNQGLLEKTNFGIYSSGNVKQLLWVDYDNDQDMDLIMSVKDGACFLYQNDGSFNFTDVTQAAGLYLGTAKNYGVTAADINKDGFLDLMLCRYNTSISESSPYNKLYLNNGNGSFSDISIQAGFHNEMMLSFMGVFLDYNMDSWPDIYVINDRSSGINKLYKNNGDLTFTEVGQSAGVGMNGEDPMTASVADFDNDNDLDIFTSNTSVYFAYKPKLYTNQGNNTFLEEASYYGANVNNTSWGGLWLDYDNDGFQDLYIATAFLNLNLAPVRSYLLKNRFPVSFLDDSTVFIGNHKANSHAVARGDIDNNGFYDIVVSNTGPDLPLLWQNSGNSSNYIKLSLEGTISNYQAVGAWIRVYAGGKQYNQYTMCGENYIGQNSQHFIFGLRNVNTADSIIVSYPSGIVDRYYSLQSGQHYHFVEGETYRFDINSSHQANGYCLGDTIVCSAPGSFVSFLWNTGDTNSSLDVYESGSYWLTAFDADSFPYYSDTISVVFYEDPTVFADLLQPSCNGFSDGSISLDITNEGQLFSILWNTGDSSALLENLAAGLYTYSYLDEFGCSFQGDYTLNEPFNLNVQSLVTNETSENLGSIQLAINGGTSPYEVFLNDSLVSIPIENLTAGNYYLEVLDENLCTYNDSITITYIADSVINFIHFIEKDEAISVYPNPFSSMLNISSEKEIQRIELISVLGELSVISTNQEIYDLDYLLPGIYFLKIFTEDSYSILKLEKSSLK